MKVIRNGECLIVVLDNGTVLQNAHSTKELAEQVLKATTEQEVINIMLPKYQEVIYAQPPYINLKFKWIQYLALLLPTLIIINYFIGFAFQNKIFDCSVLSNIPKAMY